MSGAVGGLKVVGSQNVILEEFLLETGTFVKYTGALKGFGSSETLLQVLWFAGLPVDVCTSILAMKRKPEVEEGRDAIHPELSLPR